MYISVFKTENISGNLYFPSIVIIVNYSFVHSLFYIVCYEVCHTRVSLYIHLEGYQVPGDINKARHQYYMYMYAADMNGLRTHTCRAQNASSS